MTKFYTTVLVMLAALQAHAQLATATFEDIQVDGEESFWAKTTNTGDNFWRSGGYSFNSYYYPMDGFNYYACFVVTNCKNTDGIDYTKAYQSTASGAKNGNNYAVFYLDERDDQIQSGLFLKIPDVIVFIDIGDVFGIGYCNMQNLGLRS